MASRRAVYLVLALLVAVGLTGCYRTVVQVVSAEEALAIPGLAGGYESVYNHMTEAPERNHLRLEKRPNANDYVVTMDSESRGNLRFLRLKDDIYLAQMAMETLSYSHPSFDIGFVRISGRTIGMLMAVPPGLPMPEGSGRAAFTDWLDSVRGKLLDTEIGRMAARFDVGVPGRDGGAALEGAGVDVRRFLESHRNWRFVEYARFGKLD
ncbi:MAG: hypothetical protein H7840_05555 [Alphaproteobacteria bacterium]